MYRAFVLLTFALALLIPVAAQQAPAPPAVQQPDVPEQPALAVPPGYKYDVRGRRDPFVNPIPKPAPTAKDIPVARPPGLKGVLINEATVLGVVTSKETSMNRVVIQAPGNKIYFAVSGETLFDAVIKEIRPDSVVFTLALPRGERPASGVREVVRRVNPAPGEKR